MSSNTHRGWLNNTILEREMSLISLCLCFSLSLPLADGSPLIGCRTVRMASLTRVKCALWTGLCGTAWCFHDWVRQSMFSTLEKCSKCCCSLSHHSSYRSSESTPSLPQVSALTQILLLSCFLSGLYLLSISFITKTRKMTSTERMSSAFPGIKMLVLCLDDAAQANLQCWTRTHDRAFSEVPHLSILNIFFAFLKSFLRGVRRKRGKKTKTKHEHVISTDELMSIFRVHLLLSSQAPLSSSIPGILWIISRYSCAVSMESLL